MGRRRLNPIETLIAMYIALLITFPVPTIGITIFALVIYLILKNMGKLPALNELNNPEAKNRRDALREAKIYLAPYKDIWRNLRLSNKFCKLSLQSDGSTIIGRESVAPYRTFKITRSKVHSYIDLWNMFCRNFSYNTTFKGLIELCQIYNVEIDIKNNEENTNTNISSNVQVNNIPANNIQAGIRPEFPVEKLDVNNASEVELTALPGISIVMAKKLIKKREEIGGFKSVRDVFLFLRLKPHMQTQLEKIICVKKMEGNIGPKRYGERQIDL